MADAISIVSAILLLGPLSCMLAFGQVGVRSEPQAAPLHSSCRKNGDEANTNFANKKTRQRRTGKLTRKFGAQRTDSLSHALLQKMQCFEKRVVFLVSGVLRLLAAQLY